MKTEEEKEKEMEERVKETRKEVMRGRPLGSGGSCGWSGSGHE